MQRFLKSIGFGNIRELEDQDRLLHDVLLHHDEKNMIIDEDQHLFAEISREYAPDCGITVCGIYDSDNLFHLEYYYPYFRGSQISSHEPCVVERHARTESFAAACDDMRVGTTMIFYLLNAGEYMKAAQKSDLRELQTSVSLSALADYGTILLPVIRDQRPKSVTPQQIQQKNAMFAAAEQGDEDAIESLTMEDIDTYTMLSRRIRHEDVYTIVDSYFMPYGMECDLYSIMGEIVEYRTAKNIETGEELYQMGVVCNEIRLDVCINARDLMGEPEVGRRFKGAVWLQGKINF